jgi:hypothetical protein
MSDDAKSKDKKKTCFVVGPIGGDDTPERVHADWLLKGIIIPVFWEHFPNFEVVRADTINAPGLIDSQIIERLLTFDLVIADLSFLNPNAFYELGIRHSQGGATIHMVRKGDRLPFDNSMYRAIVYSVVAP